jgi:CHAD domain-containing protein
MIKSRIECYHLPVASIGRLSTEPIGKLEPVLVPEGDAVPYTVTDQFDQSLRRSGRLLLQTDTAFELIDINSRIISSPTKHEAGFIADFPDGPLKQALAYLSPLRRLLPVGSGELQQAVLSLQDDQEKTHCRAYLIYLTTKKGRSAALVMLQGIRGYDTSLSLLRERVHELGTSPFSIEVLYEQLFPEQPALDTKPANLFTKDTTAFDAVNKIIAAYIPLVRANEQGIIVDHDTEFLHDYRVQLRKIRSVLSLFKGIHDDAQAVDVKARFSELMAPTGKLRDLDVYLLEKHTSYELVPKSLHDGLDTLHHMFAEQRTAEHIKLSRYLSGKKYRQEIANVARLFAQPKGLKRGPNADLSAYDYACELIWSRYCNVCKIAAKIDQDTPDDEIHNLRIQCKKLRYLMEFFSTVFPAVEVKKLLKPLKGLQDNLGLFNDYSVQQEYLQDVLLKLSENPDSSHLKVAQSIGALIAVHHQRQRQERAKVERSFMQFNSPDTQQAFSETFLEKKA